MIRIILICLTLLLSSLALSVENNLHFNNPDYEKRFTTLTQNLRCLVCQNQTIADSEAPLAKALLQKIYSDISEGQSDQEIINYLTARYGNFILYRPPFIKETLLLWLAPLFFLIIGVGILIKFILKKNGNH